MYFVFCEDVKSEKGGGAAVLTKRPPLRFCHLLTTHSRKSAIKFHLMADIMDVSKE